MKNTTGKLTAYFGVLVIVLGLGAVARADRKSELRERFKQRLPALAALKLEGKIGETWDGWVEGVKGALDGQAKRLVDEENNDRKELYRLIADEEKTTEDLVAQRNAQRQYRIGKKGEWFKLKNGEWKQKE